MNMSRIKQFRLAFQSLKQQRLRSVLSMLGVIFGIISIVAMLSVGEGAKRKILEQIEQLGVQNVILRSLELTEAQELYARERLSQGLSDRDVERLRKSLPGIEYVAPVKEVSASVLSVEEEIYPDILSVTSEYRLVNNLRIDLGRFIGDLDSENRNFVCVLGSDVSQSLGTGGAIGGLVRIEEEMFNVVGILAPRHSPSDEGGAVAVRDFNRTIFIPLGTESYLVDRIEPLPFAEIVVKVTEKNRIFSTALGIHSILEASHLGAQDYQVIVPQELIDKQRQTQTNFNIFLAAIALISLIVGGIGIMNIMLANVSERTHEIGIRRALGANQDHIKWQFLSESILISVGGGLIGLAGGVLLVMFISLFGRWHAVVNLWIILLSLAMAFAVGLFSGLYPAVKASKMDPIEALRFE